MTDFFTIKLRRDLAANWTTANPILALGEYGYERDTTKHKIGDGVTAWNDLSFVLDIAEGTLDGQLLRWEASTEKFEVTSDVVINDAGMGIGTSSPDKRLVLSESSGIVELVLNANDGSSNQTVRFRSNGVTKASISSTSVGVMILSAGGATERTRIDAVGNLLLGGTSIGASSVGNFHLFNGTAPTGSVTNGVILYAEDDASSSELKVRDESGAVTVLSPHNFSLIPNGPSEDMAWSHYSEKGGKAINVDILKMARLLEEVTGEKLVYERQLN